MEESCASCAVCADDLEWVAYGPCGHGEVCSTCVVRLRIVLHSFDCCICKTLAPFVFATKAMGDSTRVVADFSLFPANPSEGQVGQFWYHEDSGAFFDDLNHYRMTQAMCRLSCSVCDRIEEEKVAGDTTKRRSTFRNIEQLKGHLFHQHKLFMCRLCLEGRKIFICEQKLYTRTQLNQHIRTGDSDVDGTESERGGFAGHPVCGFCNVQFYGENELYKHMSVEHHICHICQRQKPVHYDYFRNYDDLECHFRREHLLCDDEACLAKKLVDIQSEPEMKCFFVTNGILKKLNGVLILSEPNDNDDLDELQLKSVELCRESKEANGQLVQNSEVQYVKLFDIPTQLPIPHKRLRSPVTEVGGNTTASKKNEVLLLDGGCCDYGLRIPESISSKLSDYQAEGLICLLKWHCQGVGGIMGDAESHKATEIISFLGALHLCSVYKTSIVVCPKTQLAKWKRAVGIYCPDIQLDILHKSAHRNREIRWENIIDRAMESDSALVLTTYKKLLQLGGMLLDIEWGYAILDEGQRIKDPDNDLTLVCKQLKTLHRIILTNVPFENKLRELWSLLDFAVPGKLGVFPVFEGEFGVPIKHGEYVNATPVDRHIATRCAISLGSLVKPYVFRRIKSDACNQLPKYTEEDISCFLMPKQQSRYSSFLKIQEENLTGRGVKVALQKIIDHPDLLEREAEIPDYGSAERSGKMKVLCNLLKRWKLNGSRVIVYAETKAMIKILEKFLISAGYNYRRIDKQGTVFDFKGSEVFICIVTIKVGLGAKLTGANKIVCYNPVCKSFADMQVKENTCGIDTTLLRLVTEETVEEENYKKIKFRSGIEDKPCSSSSSSILIHILDDTLKLDSSESMDETAYKIEKEAMKTLLDSQSLRSRESLFVPTWTGRSGTAGKPPLL